MVAFVSVSVTAIVWKFKTVALKILIITVTCNRNLNCYILLFCAGEMQVI